MAVTSENFVNRGIPSAWSAVVDVLASAALEQKESSRLFFVSAGNADQNAHADYPNSNLTDQVENPAQAWNCLTVGSFTEKVTIDPESAFADAVPLASSGSLSPHSTTSLEFQNEWPNKPDIVLEGGNLARHPSHPNPFEHASLRLLTTNSDWQKSLLVDFGATSAATALAARMGAILLAEYPEIWPETVRALLVHSADWTTQMRMEFGNDKRGLLRCYGYGVPDLDRALQSLNNSVTLIVEDQLAPFIKDGSSIKLNEMKVHSLPWPRDVLLSLAEVNAKLRVTLSYFIEPNPGERGYRKKHTYASHQLRFATKTSGESDDAFMKRINKLARDEDEEFNPAGGAGEGWFLKEHKASQRNKGSIHSDIWTGNAADLATKDQIAVYPVGGWWKDLKKQEKWDSIARYSLIISISTEEAEVDLYNFIRNNIEIPIEIPTIEP